MLLAAVAACGASPPDTPTAADVVPTPPYSQLPDLSLTK